MTSSLFHVYVLFTFKVSMEKHESLEYVVGIRYEFLGVSAEYMVKSSKMNLEPFKMKYIPTYAFSDKAIES